MSAILLHPVDHCLLKLIFNCFNFAVEIWPANLATIFYHSNFDAQIWERIKGVKSRFVAGVWAGACGSRAVMYPGHLQPQKKKKKSSSSSSSSSSS